MYGNKRIWEVSYPIFLGLLAQNVINVTDTAFLGRVGEVELGASAMGGLYYICIFTIAFGFSTGSQILIARRNGERDYRAVGPILTQGIGFLLVLAALLFGFSRLFAGTVMGWLISSEAIRQATTEFLDWRIYGFFFVFIGVMFRALFIGITRTKVLTLNALVMAVTNIVLDYLLIFGHGGFPQMGIRGAALASVIAEATSILFYVAYTYFTVDRAKYALERFRSFDFGLLRHVLSISIFTMLQYFVSLSTFFMLFIAVEHLGQRPLAIANIVRSIYVVLLIPISSLSMTTNTFVSNSIGAGHTDEVPAIIRRLTGWSALIMLLLLVTVCLFPRAILSVYTNEAALITASVPSIYVIAVALFISAAANIVFNGLTGTGNTKAALYIELVTLCFYAFFIYLFGIRLHQPVSVCFGAEIIYYTSLLLLSLWYLKYADWRKKAI